MRNVTALVEGFHDRAFLAGWLRSRQWTDPGARSSGARKPVSNPVTGERVTGGRYAFYGPNGQTFIELVPVHGDSNVLREVASRVRRAVPGDPDELLVVLDVDDADVDGGSARRRQALADRLVGTGLSITEEADQWTSAHLVVRAGLWCASVEELPAVPTIHCLERVVCAALARTYPARARAVATWLSSRPEPPDSMPKEHSWSFMAGWYAHRGCEDFLSGLWEDVGVAKELDRILSEGGLKRHIERLEF